MQHIGFGSWNWTAVIVYLMAMLLVGAYLTKRASQDTNSFFKASGHLLSRAVGLSIYTTTLSAIMFMSTPEEASSTNWAYIAGNITIVTIIPMLVAFYVPFFKRLHVTLAYEYLEARLGPSIRLVGLLLFITFHLGRIIIIIYLPTLVITAVSDINPYIVTSSASTLCILCALLGGLEGAVWSDFIQGVILLGGALSTTIIGAFEIKDGFGTVVHDTIANKKILSTDSWELSSVAAAIPIIFLGSTFNNLHQYIVSQGIAQRYQASEFMEEIEKSLWTNSALALISAPIFYGMGTMMYPSYQHQEMLPKDSNTSSIVPYFILTEMPPFTGGLLIATMLATAQSTISPSLNSISACTSKDIEHRFFGKRDGRPEMKFTRLIIVAADLLSYGISMYSVAADSNSLWDSFLLIIGLSGASLVGIFTVEVLIRHVNTSGVIVGLFAGVAVTYLLHGIGGGSSPLYVSIVSFLVAFVLGYITNLLVLSKNVKGITDLTIYDKNKAPTYISKIAKRN